MPTLRVYPISDDTIGCQRSAGATNYGCVDESGASDGQYVYTHKNLGAPTAAQTDDYGIDASALPADAIISSITVYDTSDHNPSHPYSYWKPRCNGYNGGTAQWVSSWTWTTNPDTGVAWTRAGALAATIGVSQSISNIVAKAAEVQTEKVYADIVYTQPGQSLLDQKHFRFYQDDAGLNAATALAAEDTDITAAVNDTVRLRIETANTGAAVKNNLARKLQVSMDGGAYADISTSNGRIRLQLSSQFADGDATTARLTATGVFQAGQGKESGAGTTNLNLTNGNYTEDEFCLNVRQSAGGHSFDFRLIDDTAEDQYETYTVTPTITVAAVSEDLGLDIRLYNGPAPTGDRKHLPIHKITGVNWELIREGYFGNCDVDVMEDYDSGSAATGGDRLEVWYNSELRYRGYVVNPEKRLDIPEGKAIHCYGQVEKLNSIRVGQIYAYPGGQDVSIAVARIFADHIAPNFVFLESDIQSVGYTVENLPFETTYARDAMQELSDMCGGNVYWGFDTVLDPDGSGQLIDRFFFRPLDTSVLYKYQVGGKVREYTESPSYADIRNVVWITGGEAKYPNLVADSSFEQPKQADASDGNLVQNPGFESGSGSDANNWTEAGAIRVDTKKHSGGYCMSFDDNGDAITQAAITVTALHNYNLDFWMRVGSAASAYEISVVWKDGGGATLSTSSVAATTVTGPTNRYTLRSHVFTAPTSAATATITITRNHANPFRVDDVAFYDQNGVTQTGWQIKTSSATCVTDWMYPSAQDGAYSVKLEATGITGADYVRLEMVEENEFEVTPNRIYNISAWIYNQDGAAHDIKLWNRVTHDDGSKQSNESAALSCAAGAWTHVFWSASGFTAGSDASRMRVGVKLTENANLLVDAVMVCLWDATDPYPDFLRGTNYFFRLTTDDTFIQTDPDMPAAVKTSITDWGERETDETAEGVTNITEAQNWCKGYFGIHAQPVAQHTVELDDVTNVIEPTGQFKLLNSTAATAYPVTVKYSIGPDMFWKISLDLTIERPSFDGILARLMKKLKGQTQRATAGTGYAPPGGGGGGGETHAREHTLLSTADHTDVATYLDQALLQASSPTFANLTLSTKLTTPQIVSPAATNLNILPPAGYSAILGDTGGGGTYRPLLIADVAHQTRPGNEALKVFATRAPGAATDDVLTYLSAWVSNVDETKRFSTLQAHLYFDGANKSHSNSQVADFILHLDTTATFPATSGLNPLSVTSSFLSMEDGFTGGNVPEAVLHILSAIYDASGTSTLTQLWGLKGVASLAVADKVVTMAWLRLPHVANVTNFSHLSLGDVSGNYWTNIKLGTQAANLSYTLPTAIVTNGFLKTAADGTLSWEVVTGYTNLTSFINQTAWRLFYSNVDGDVVELAIGAIGTVLQSAGAAAAPTWAAVAGTGDVTAAANLTDNCIVRGDGGVKGVQTSGIIIDDSNRMGIGRTPTCELDVYRSGASVNAIIEANGDYWPFLFLQRTGGTTKTNQSWRLAVASTGPFQIYDYTNSKDVLTIAPTTGSFTFLDGANFIFGTTTGTKIGTATTQKLALWNATPVVQPASANQAALTNSTGGSYDGTLAALTTYNAATINNNFTDIYTLLTALRTALLNAGVIKGSA